MREWGREYVSGDLAGGGYKGRGRRGVGGVMDE